MMYLRNDDNIDDDDETQQNQRIEMSEILGIQSAQTPASEQCREYGKEEQQPCVRGTLG